jgi:hypothetical protein
LIRCYIKQFVICGVEQSAEQLARADRRPSRSFPTLSSLKAAAAQQKRSVPEQVAHMPIPRKLLRAAFESISEKTLRKVAEHHDIRGSQSASKVELCKKLSSDDGTCLQSYTGYFTVPELKAIASVFGIDSKGKTKDELDAAIWGFVQGYDRIARKLTYEEVFASPRSPDFAAKLRDWMEARHSTSKLAQLSDGEQVLWQIRYVLMEINGNSFPGVFEGGDDDRPQQFVRALREIGAKKSATAFERIGSILFDGDIPKTADARSRKLTVEDEDQASAFDERLDACRDIWEKSDEDIAALSVRFAANNPDRFRSSTGPAGA